MGGKSTIADQVWQALGNVKSYYEPFFGSGAVLLARPGYVPGHHIETVCDIDGLLANAWRGLQFAPDEVARWCDWPVSHIDLNARRRRLIAEKDGLVEKLTADDKYFDAELAGYWIWAASCWIGSGLTCLNARPQLADGGQGVHAGIAVLQDETLDVRAPYNVKVYTWFRRLSERLRYVRVVCGDWTRVCGGDWQDGKGTVGYFFDPPYGVQDRDTKIYETDSIDVAHAVRAWALERGNRRSYRIVLAGYEEHQELVEHGWQAVHWKAGGGYSNLGKVANQNRKRETLYLSPHCVKQGQML